MRQEKELLIFDLPLKLYTYLGLPDDCIDSKERIAIR